VDVGLLKVSTKFEGERMLDRKIFVAACVVAMGSFGLSVRAEDPSAQDARTNEIKMKVEDAAQRKNVTPGDDIDETITNNKIRAETGSKSRWSFSSALNYNGGNVGRAFGEERPNISGTSGLPVKSDLEGTVSTKFNMNAKNSLSAGVGVRWMSPLQGHPHNYNGSTVDASNPYVTYQNLNKFAGIQSVFQVTPTVFTNSNLVDEGYVSSLGITEEMLYEIPRTGLSLGMYFWINGAVYDKTGPGAGMADVREDQSDYAFNIDPFAEYQLNDKINLRTVSNLWNYEHMRSEPRGATFRWDKVYQSIGVGFSVTRDIFIYPNIQFLPDNIRADLTNVAVNTNINLF
jgi:hypothetical protein